MNESLDPTGVPVLSGDSTGYFMEGMPVTYKLARGFLSWKANKYPESIEQCRADAEFLNRVHLFRTTHRSGERFA